MCFQEKRREEKLCFRTLSPHIKSLPRWFDRGILRKMYTENKNAQKIRHLNKQPKD